MDLSHLAKKIAVAGLSGARNVDFHKAFPYDYLRTLEYIRDTDVYSLYVWRSLGLHPGKVQAPRNLDEFLFWADYKGFVGKNPLTLFERTHLNWSIRSADVDYGEAYRLLGLDARHAPYETLVDVAYDLEKRNYVLGQKPSISLTAKLNKFAQDIEMPLPELLAEAETIRKELF